MSHVFIYKQKCLHLREYIIYNLAQLCIYDKLMINLLKDWLIYYKIYQFIMGLINLLWYAIA